MIKIQYLLLISLLFITINTTVSIIQPRKTDFKDNKLNYSYANFGVVHYGKTQTYSLYITNQTLCNQTSKIKNFKKPTYILVKGNLSQCSYPNKAINAQKLGARGIIFASQSINWYDGNVVLADDGNGRKVHITSLFISPQTSDSLKKLKNIQIRVNFDLKKRDKSQMVLFLSSSGRDNYVFLRNFKKYYDQIKQSINLKLVYHTFKCQWCGDAQCVLANNFCQFDSDRWQYGAGAYIVNQQFRQWNLFQLMKSKNKIDTWFQYMNKFDQNCDVDWINSKDCSKQIAKQLGIQQNLGFGDQFGTMSDWRQLEVSSGIYSFPDVTVNGYKHMQNLQPISVFQMVCGSLKTPPNACTGEATVVTGTKTGVIVGLVIGSIVLFLLSIYCYKTMIKRQITNDISLKVGQLVAKYGSRVSEQSKKRREKVMQRMTQQL